VQNKFKNTPIKLKLIHIELVLYVLFSNFYINLIGSISISELWVLLLTPFILRKKLFLQFPLLKNIAFIYAFLFLSQLISELILGNEFNNMAKGLMTTVVSFLSLIYLVDRLKKNYHLIVLILLFFTIRDIYFMNSTGLGENSVSFNLESNSFFKYKITPILTDFALFISFFLLRRGYKTLTIGMFMGLILIYISFSARSASLVLFFCAIMLLFGENLVKNRKRILPGLLIVMVVSYGGYIGWVKYQLTGELRVRNEQIDRMRNPYNPFEMLEKGRGEFFVGIMAFKDAFLWGHGAWTTGQDTKYVHELQKIQGNIDSENITGLIPAHSIIVGAGVNNGIFAFVFISILIVFFFRLQFSIFKDMIKTPLAMIFLSQIIGLFWTSLFSPMAHFRVSLPFMFAITLILYTNTQKYKRLISLSKKKEALKQNENNTSIQII